MLACRKSLPACALAVSAALVARPSAGADGEAAHGAPGPTAAEMTLGQALAAGARRAPAVVEASRTHAAAGAFAARPGSSLPSVPLVTVLAGARRPALGLPLGPEVTVSVTQEISAGPLGGARRRAAEGTARAAGSELDLARLEGAVAAGLTWLDLLEAQELLRLREAARADAVRLAEIAEVRVVSGVATAAERSLAAAETGAARLAILEGEGRATEARLALALATGEPMDRALGARGALDAERLDASAAGVERSHPAVQVAEGRAAQHAAEASVARATSGPMFAVGATAWREGSGDHGAAATVSVPLPLFDSSRYEAGRFETLAAAESARAARLRAELERERRLVVHEREHTREVRDQLRAGLVEPLRRALVTAVTAYSAGTSDLGVVLLARRSALGAEERLVSAMIDVRRADLRLAALTGTLTQPGAR